VTTTIIIVIIVIIIIIITMSRYALQKAQDSASKSLNQSSVDLSRTVTLTLMPLQIVRTFLGNVRKLTLSQ